MDLRSDVRVEVPAGGVVAFSSLTPHCTGPNRTDAVRKSYIVQYAPEGAEILVGDERVRADDAERQFPVLVAGQPLATR